MVRSSKSIEFAEKVILTADDSTFNKYKNNNFDTVFIADPKLNEDFKVLVSMNLYKRDSLLAIKAEKITADSITRVAVEAEKV